MNDTADPRGLVPILPLFFVLFRLLIKPHDLPDQRMRLKLKRGAIDERVKLIALTRVRTALQCNVPIAADTDIRIGDRVFFFREKPPRWLGPYQVVNVRGKMVLVDVDGTSRPFSIQRLLMYNVETPPDTRIQDDSTETSDTVPIYDSNPLNDAKIGNEDSNMSPVNLD